MKIATIIGARPQFIKAAVVSRAIAEYNKLETPESTRVTEVIIHTGQHYDHNMSEVFFEEMRIPEPDYLLDIHGLSHGAMTGQMLARVEEVLVEEKPDIVLVYGDTNTTLAGALAAAKMHIPVAHVEAGLRSFNRRMPEEINRLLTDHISSYLFCPTQQAVQNLKDEGIGDKRSSVHKLASSSAILKGDESSTNTKNSSTHELTSSQASRNSRHQPISLSAMSYERPPTVALVGDVMLDAVLYYQQYARQPRIELPDHFILATVHRAENTDDRNRLESIFKGFEKISREVTIILPLHPRTLKIIKRYNFDISYSAVKIIEPVGYLEMIYMLDNCNAVMTDSGGLQKEAYFFRKPCITLRDETEWVELVEHGFNQLSIAEDQAIYDAYKKFTANKIKFDRELYGDGRAGEKILDFLISNG